MLATLLPLIESLTAGGGAAMGARGAGGMASSLGRSGGPGATISRLLGGGQVEAFGSQQEMGGALSQISELTRSIGAARDSMSQMRAEHDQLGAKATHDEQNYGFRDPQEADRMADLQRQQIQQSRQMQLHQQQMEGLQSRAAVTMSPELAAQEQRGAMFRRAGALAVGAQAVQSFGPGMLQNMPGAQALGSAAEFTGGTGGKIAVDAAKQAAGSVSNIAGGAMNGAALGGMVGGPIGAGVGAVVGGVAAAAGDISKLPENIVKWSEALLDSQKSISRFNGTLTATFAEENRRGISRAIDSGERTAGTTSELSGSMQRLFDQLQPMKDAMTNTVGSALTIGVKTLSSVLGTLEKMLAVTEILETIAEAVKSIEEYFYDPAEDKKPEGDIAQKLWRDIQLHDRRKPREVPRR